MSSLLALNNKRHVHSDIKCACIVYDALPLVIILEIWLHSIHLHEGLNVISLSWLSFVVF